MKEMIDQIEDVIINIHSIENSKIISSQDFPPISSTVSQIKDLRFEINMMMERVFEIKKDGYE